MHTIAIHSYKGGTGKTTTAVNLSYDLSLKGYRVLLVDTDPQANATAMFSKVTNNSATLADVFKGKPVKGIIRRTNYKDLDIIRGTDMMEEAEGEPDVLHKALSLIADRYDYCIIDCHPSMQLPTIAALVAADHLLLAFKPDGFGLSGVGILDEYIGQIRKLFNERLRYHLCVTQFAGRKSQVGVLTDLVEKYHYPMMETFISYGEAVNTSIERRKPLAAHRRKAKVTQDYFELTEELVKLVEAGEEA